MKRTKRIFAIFMTLALAMSMLIVSSAVSFAASVNTTTTTHTYEIYQIYTGEFNSTNNEIKNLKYGQNAATDAANIGKAVSKTDMATLAEIQKNEAEGKYADDQARIAALLPLVNLNSTPVDTLSKEKKSSDELAPGYYIIKDKDNTVSDPDTYSLYMFKILKDELTIVPKDGTTEAVKKVDDVNDSTGEGTQLKDSADYDIGDDVPYTLTFKLPKNYTDFKEYAITFFDDMSEGLTLNTNSVKIFYGDSDTAGHSIQFTSVDGTQYTGGQKYKYEIADLKKVADASSVTNNDVIKITYTAKLNDKAKLGKPGNPNEYQVQYSNNPNGTGTNITTPDVNKVFTYKVVVNKVDPDKKPLSGAEFTLYKEVSDSTTEGAAKGSDIKDAYTDAAVKAKAAALSDNKYYVVVSHEELDATGATFEFKGIDDGNYVLVETTVPTGYNAWNSTAFSVSAAHDLGPADDPQLTELTGGDLFTGTVGSVDLDNGTLTTTVVNESGAELPETGGIGTIIFYVLGSLLVVGCGIVLISKRRMESR
ncbi:MAG: isopeptide-forming domain-containing fimbrial protein [Mogibacterium sp.]|nr:isopeptide-forming domain-containing fimbrial protein [Mogibacterium sp.]